MPATSAPPRVHAALRGLIDSRGAIVVERILQPVAAGAARLRPRSILFMALAAAIVAAAAWAPATAGLAFEGRMVLAILAAGILLWVTESMPLPATALLILVLMPVTGVCSFEAAYANAMGSTVFFLMGTFAFTVALDATTVPTRIAARVLA